MAVRARHRTVLAGLLMRHIAGKKRAQPSAGVPQPLQNLPPGGSWVPQPVQNFFCAAVCTTGLPQLAQNFAPAASRALQCGQPASIGAVGSKPSV